MADVLLRLRQGGLGLGVGEQLGEAGGGIVAEGAELVGAQAGAGGGEGERLADGEELGREQEPARVGRRRRAPGRTWAALWQIIVQKTMM